MFDSELELAFLMEKIMRFVSDYNINGYDYTRIYDYQRSIPIISFNVIFRGNEMNGFEKILERYDLELDQTNLTIHTNDYCSSMWLRIINKINKE